VTWKIQAAADTEQVETRYMKNTRRALGWLCVGSALSFGCSDDPVLGKNGCFGEKTVCTSDAPTYNLEYDWYYLHFVDDATNKFDVTPDETLAPTWRYEWPCELFYCHASQVALAPDGDVWVALGYAYAGELRRIDTDGKLVGSHDWVPPSVANPAEQRPFQLLVDAEYNPVLLYTEPGTYFGVFRSVRFDAHGILTTAELPLDTDSSAVLALAGADNSLQFLEHRPEGLVAESYDARRQLVWRQDNLRVEAEAWATQASYIAGSVALRDGGFVFWTDKAEREIPNTSSAITSPIAGITVVDQDGNLRWDAYVADVGGSYRLAEGKDGSLVATFVNGAGDLNVALISAAGKLEAGWLGRRFDFFPVVPTMLAVDPAGDAYLALITGERDAPELTLCKLTMQDVQQDVVCVAIERPLGAEFRTFLHPATLPGRADLADLAAAMQLTQMVAPEPNVILLWGIAPPDPDVMDADSNLVMRLIRVDFPSAQ
jgi:hypothetical protein